MMTSNPFYRLFFLLCLFVVSCEQEIILMPRNEKPSLVVEGTITNQPPPYTVVLSYSGNYSRSDTISGSLFINDATVTIEDDLGNSTPCLNTGRGNYLSSDSAFTGVIGRTYKIKVTLRDRKEYVSAGETMMPVAPIEKVHVVVDNAFTAAQPTKFAISIDTKDPAGTRNYYNWKALSFAPRKATGVPCGFSCRLGEYCLQEYRSRTVNILSDQLIDGNNIMNQVVMYSPIYWFGRHFIEIKQHSLTQSAYLFWEKYKEQVSRTGNIGDPLPAPLEGNIANTTDPSDLALGYFGASAVVVKKVKIVPFFLTEYLLLSIAGGFIEDGDCSILYPKAFYNYADPVEWAGAEIIEVR